MNPYRCYKCNKVFMGLGSILSHVDKYPNGECINNNNNNNKQK